MKNQLFFLLIIFHLLSCKNEKHKIETVSTVKVDSLTNLDKMLVKYSLEKKQFNDSLVLKDFNWAGYMKASKSKNKSDVFYPSKEKENSFIVATNYKPNIKDDIL